MTFNSHCVKEKQQRFGNRAMVGILSILIAFSLLGWIYLSQASHVAVVSRHVQELEAEKIRLQEQNLQLMAEIAESESVAGLASRAAELGFVSAPVDQAEFLVIAEPQSPGAMLARTSSADHWWDKVAAQFTTWAQAGSQ